MSSHFQSKSAHIPPFENTLAQWVRSFREMNHLTQAQMAEISRVSVDTIKNVEGELNVSSHTVQAIAKACLPEDQQQRFCETFYRPTIRKSRRVVQEKLSATMNTDEADASLASNHADNELNHNLVLVSNINEISTPLAEKPWIVSNRNKWLISIIGLICLLLGMNLFSTQYVDNPSSTPAVPIIPTVVSETATLKPYDQDKLQREQAQKEISDAYRWPLIFEDHFDPSPYAWPVSTTYNLDDYGDHRLQILDERLLFDARSKTPDGATIWDLDATMPTVSDFYLTVDITCLVCNPDTSPGILFRNAGPVDSESFYYIRLRFDQSVVVGMQPSRQQRKLLFEGLAPGIHPRKHETNRLEILARDGHFIFFINGIYVTTIEEATFSEGSIHTFVMLEKATEVQIAYDNIEVRVPTK